jgi:tetratricopeptide (TPR) repeat protein
MCSPFRKPGLFFLILILSGLFLAPGILAQNRTIRGKVVNDKGEPVPSAKIRIMLMAGKREYPVSTDKKGEYLYMNIATGTYRVVCRAPGYDPYLIENFSPKIGDNELNITLQPGDPNLKLPFELSPEEQEKMRQQAVKDAARAKMAGEIKAAFEAGRALADQNNYEGAIVEYKKALEKAPDEPVVLANLADAQAKLGQNEEALTNYQKAAVASPTDAAIWTNIGVVLGKLGKVEESKEAFKKAASLSPGGAAAQNFYNLGATMVNSGQPKEAAEAFRQAIAADANYAEAYYQLGLCLSGDPETMAEAVQMLEKYVKIGKNEVNLGVAKDLIAVLKK